MDVKMKNGRCCLCSRRKIVAQRQDIGVPGGKTRGRTRTENGLKSDTTTTTTTTTKKKKKKNNKKKTKKKKKKKKMMKKKKNEKEEEEKKQKQKKKTKKELPHFPFSRTHAGNQT
jgi:alpha-D-ribose 1-methylphosphonate 5-triphosphate synthase subunit PhnI